MTTVAIPTRAAAFENLAAVKRCVNITVDRSERVCVNCVYYERYYRQNRGNIYGWTGTNKGYCIKHERGRGPLTRVCREFEGVPTTTAAQ